MTQKEKDITEWGVRTAYSDIDWNKKRFDMAWELYKTYGTDDKNNIQKAIDNATSFCLSILRRQNQEK